MVTEIKLMVTLWGDRLWGGETCLEGWNILHPV